MGLFGKSKEEKEREQRLEQEKAHQEIWERQFIQSEVYQKLVAAILKVEAMSPSWSVGTFRTNLRDTEIESAEGTHISPDGICVLIELKSGHGASLRIMKLKPNARQSGSFPRALDGAISIYGVHFPQDQYKPISPHFKFLSQWIRKMLEPHLLAKQKERAESHSAQRAAQEEFWKS
jgi:hypothetical protein